MRTSKLRAIILKRINFGEADKMVTAFSLEKGKVVLVAKGVRRIKSRRAPHLEPLGEVELITHQNIITEAKSFSKREFDLKSLGFALYAAEIIDKLLPENQPHEEVYQLLKNYLQNSQLNENEAKKFAASLIWSLGFYPHGQYPKEGLTNYVEQIAERRIRSKSLIDESRG